MAHFSGILFTKPTGSTTDESNLSAMVSKMQLKDSSAAPIVEYHTEQAVLVAAAHDVAQSTDDRFILLFSGDLYNHRELTVHLKQHGVKASVNSPAALILAGFTTRGLSFFNHIRGSLSVAIWDKKLNNLILVRDHMGIANLYWSSKTAPGNSQLLLFSTTIKSLLQSGAVDRKLNRAAFYNFVRYHAVIPPLTLIESISAVKPGCSVTLQANDEISRQYWSMEELGTDATITDPQSIAHRVHDSVYSAVKLAQPTAGVPTLMVDGSIDSALLVAVNAAKSSLPLQTFSFAYDGKPVRDNFAYNLSDRYGCKQENVTVDGRSFKNYLDRLSGAPELPGTDVSVPFLFSLMGSSEQPVLLHAKGVKELLRGRRYFKDVSLLSEWKKCPVKSHFLPALSFGYKNFPYVRSFAAAQQFDFLKHWPVKQDEFYLSTRTLFSHAEYFHVMHRKLHTYPDTSALLAHDVNAIFDQDSDFLNSFAKLELIWNVANAPLSYENNLSSSVRFPFLTPDLIELLMNVPSNYKFSSHAAVLKPLIDDVGAGSLFDQYGVVQSEPAGLPVGVWLTKYCTAELRQLAQAPWAKGEGMSQLIFKLYKNPQQYQKVWSLLQFKQWIDHYQIEV